MILPLYASIERMDKSLVEASYDLGHGKVSTLFRVIIPTIAPGLIAGRPAGVHPRGRRLRHAGAARRREDPDVRQHGLRPVQQRQQLAARFGDVGPADGVHPVRRLHLPPARSGRTRCEPQEPRCDRAISSCTRSWCSRSCSRRSSSSSCSASTTPRAAPTSRASRPVGTTCLIHNARALQAFRNTLKVAIVATIVSTIIGTLAAFALTRYNFRGRSGYSTLIFICLVMPEIVMGDLADGLLPALRARRAEHLDRDPGAHHLLHTRSSSSW